MKHLRLSVIIPAYNEALVIGKCLDSLLTQTRKADEIIVIDDSSTDQTLQIVKKYSVTILTQDHAGPGKARNLGAKKASGDILIFVDADMTFDKDFLNKLVTPIEQGRAKGVFNTDEFVSNYGNPWAKCWNLNQGLTTKRRMDPKNIHDVQDFRAILKSEFDRVKGFDLTGYTDSRTLVRKLGYYPEPVSGAISYHANPGSLAEVFSQVRWIGRRQTRFGALGKLLNLIHYSLPYSIIIGTLKSIRFQDFHFIVFKVIYDLGFWLSSLETIAGTATAK